MGHNQSLRNYQWEEGEEHFGAHRVVGGAGRGGHRGSYPHPTPDGCGPALERHMGLSLVGGECEGREAWEIALLQDVTTSSHFPIPKYESLPAAIRGSLASGSKNKSPLGPSWGLSPPHGASAPSTTWAPASTPALLAESPLPGREQGSHISTYLTVLQLLT